MTTTTLLIIDAQKDFHPGGSLAIPTANDDATRIANLIRRHSKDIDRVVATLDSHLKLHIANPCFWISGEEESKHPDPFTIISADDLRKGIWKPRPDLKLPLNSSGSLDETVFTDIGKIQDDDGAFDITKYCIEYATRLEEKGRFQICIWPEHCLIGSDGHAVVDEIRKALDEWGESTGGSVEWVLKGQNLLTEMYSAIEADVPVSKETAFNETLHESLMKSCDRLLVCGQAMSHCVNYTVRDLVARWPKDQRHQICVITDCASAVPGFEAAAELFLKDVEAEGVKLIKSSDV